MRLAGDRSYGPRQVLRDGPPQPERMTSTAGQWLARPEIGGHTRRQQVMPHRLDHRRHYPAAPATPARREPRLPAPLATGQPRTLAATRVAAPELDYAS